MFARSPIVGYAEPAASVAGGGGGGYVLQGRYFPPISIYHFWMSLQCILQNPYNFLKGWEWVYNRGAYNRGIKTSRNT